MLARVKGSLRLPFGHPWHGLRAWLSFRQVLGQPKAAIKVALYSTKIRRTLPEDHNKHSLKWYNFLGEPHYWVLVILILAFLNSD